MQRFDDVFSNNILKLIRLGTEDMRADVIAMRNLLGSMDMRQKALQTDVNSLKITIRTQSSELIRNNILLEDLNDRFATARQLSWD